MIVITFGCYTINSTLGILVAGTILLVLGIAGVTDQSTSPTQVNVHTTLSDYNFRGYGK